MAENLKKSNARTEHMTAFLLFLTVAVRFYNHGLKTRPEQRTNNFDAQEQFHENPKTEHYHFDTSLFIDH
jgi:hypothetical protein